MPSTLVKSGFRSGILVFEQRNSSGAIHFGVDGTGLDIKFFGATSSVYMEWDESADELEMAGATIAFTGDPGTSIDFAGVTATPDANRTDIAIGYGTRATEKDISMAASNNQNLDPVQFNLNIIGSNPSNSSQTNVIYQLITHDTTDMDNLRLKGGDWSIALGKNVKDAYIFQGEIDFSGTVTVGGEAAVLGLTMNAGSGTVSGNLWGIVMVTTGASLPSGSSAAIFLSHRGGTLTHSVYIEANSSQTITDAIYLNAAGTITNVINIAGIANTVYFLKVNAEAGCVENFSSAGSGIASIKCRIASTDGWIHVYDSA